MTPVMNVVGHGADGVVLLLWRDVFRVHGAYVAPRFTGLSTPKTLITTRSDDYIADCTVYCDSTKNERSAERFR